MKIVQTCWTGNNTDTAPLALKGGWVSPEYHWMSWALSCLQLKRIFGEVELYTDTLGKKILIDELQLPYHRVHVVLDDVLDGLPNEVWALAKIRTYSLQQEPFIHFDGDLFLWRAISPALLEAQVLVQNQERDLEFYRVTLDEINRNFTHLPACCRPEAYCEGAIMSINAGIIGGNDLGFFKRYHDAAFAFVCDNREQLGSLKTENLNFIFEQYFLACQAKQEGLALAYVSEQVVDNLMYGEYVNFSRIPEIGFIHPVSGHKKNVHVCDNLSRVLRAMYPAVHERILHKTRAAGVPLVHRVFVDEEQLIVDAAAPAKSDFFTRTRASLKHLQTLHQGANPEQLAMLDELFTLENTRMESIRTFLNGRQAMEDLYHTEAGCFQEVDQAFRQPVAVLFDRRIVRNRSIRPMRVTSNWTCYDMDKVEQMVSDNFSTDVRIDEQLVLVPKIMRMEIDEYLLDPLDSILFDLCSEPRSIREILSTCAGYFDETEIRDNPAGFESLIINSLVRLCHLDVLYPSNEFAT